MLHRDLAVDIIEFSIISKISLYFNGGCSAAYRSRRAWLRGRTSPSFCHPNKTRTDSLPGVSVYHGRISKERRAAVDSGHDLRSIVVLEAMMSVGSLFTALLTPVCCTRNREIRATSTAAIAVAVEGREMLIAKTPVLPVRA